MPNSLTLFPFHCYGVKDNSVKTTDALTKDTLCVFDGRDRKTSCTDRISGVTAYTYDGNNNLLTLTDAQSGATSYAYDVRNLLVEELFPGHSLPSNNERRAYTYDAAHRLKSRLDQNLDSTTYTYDRIHRLTTRAYPDTLNDTFAYDAASRLTSAVSGRYSNTVARTYDAASRLATETQTLGGVNYVLGYAYDASNRQTSVTYPSGKIVARTFTARNQLATVSFDGTSVVNPITYDNGMRRTTMAYNNGRADTIGYGTRLDNLPVSKSTDGSTTNFAYGWDANKRKTGENDSIVTNNVQTFGYDDQDRLTSFNRSSVYTQAWTLSTVGDWSSFNDNGSSTSRTHNSVHELTAIGATSLTYDTKGNLTSNSNAQTYAWDFENRLTSAVVPTGSTIGTVGTHSYKYDALGRRVSKTVAGTTTTVYVSDGSQEIAEYASGGAANAPQIQYVFGSYIDEPLMMISGSNKYYYHSNNLYSVAALTDSGGSVVERYRYDPYGKVTILAADGVTVRTTSSYGNPWTWEGRRSDQETGLMQFRQRMYGTNLGRFLTRWNDQKNDVHLYEFQHCMPTIQTDPYGDPTPIHAAIAIGAAVGAIAIEYFWDWKRPLGLVESPGTVTPPPIQRAVPDDVPANIPRWTNGESISDWGEYLKCQDFYKKRYGITDDATLEWLCPRKYGKGHVYYRGTGSTALDTEKKLCPKSPESTTTLTCLNEPGWDSRPGQTNWSGRYRETKSAGGLNERGFVDCCCKGPPPSVKSINAQEMNISDACVKACR